MAEPDVAPFRIEPSPDHPGWTTFDTVDPTRFNARVLGATLMRRDGDHTARVRILPGAHLANVMGGVHGGALLGLIDVSLFAALRTLTDRSPATAVTLDLTTQFIAPGRMDRALDSVVELLRETRRLAFLRDRVEQDESLVAAFQATVRTFGDPA